VLRVLGALEIDGADGPVSVGGPVPRRILAALLTSPGAFVPVDHLLDAAWGDEPPASAERTLQSHLTRLRDALLSADPSGATLVERRNGSYRLVVDPQLVDVVRFEGLIDRSRDQAAVDAVPLLREALHLWRAPTPYSDLQDTAYPSAVVSRLHQERGAAHEALCVALLDSGDNGGAESEAEAGLHGDPFREGLWEALIVALYRQGRQGEALEAYQRARRRLDEELGVEPGPALRDLEARVLRQDPTLLVASSPRRIPCPYKGLARYDAGDAALFVGRESLVDELVARLVDGWLLVVVGPSGAGKSSVVRAGLVPALAAGALPGSSEWTVHVAIPGTDPVGVLDRELAARPHVLVLDQAEEALLADDGARVGAVGDRLLRAADSGIRVVLVLRADFYGRLAEHPELAMRAGPGTVLVAPPRDEELRRIVVEPAARVGLRVDPALADLVVGEVRGRPGSLPVISTALVRAWEQREGDTLTVASYRAGGGVEAALQRAGEDAWTALASDERRTACRRILLRLALDEDGSWVRRRARRIEVAPTGDTAAEAALAVLTDRRLVVARADDVEIAHEALLTGWPRLLGWLEDGRAHAAVRERLAIAVASWDSAGRDETELYAGTRLQAALDTAAASPGDISPLEQEFLAQSSARAELELVEQRARADREARGRRRIRAVAAGLTVALVLAAAAGGYAIRQQRQAEAAANAADAGRLSALARTGGDYDLALLLAAQAVTIDPSPQTESDLFATLLRGDAVVTTLRAPGHLRGVAYTADGEHIVAVTDNGRLVRWPSGGGSPVSDSALNDRGVARGGEPLGLTLTPAGEAVVSITGILHPGPAYYDVADGSLTDAAIFALPPAWAVSPDGQVVVTGVLNPDGYPGVGLLVWRHGTPESSAVAVPLKETARAVTACGPVVACVLTDADTLVRVRYADGAIVGTTPVPAGTRDALAASTDGRSLAFVGSDLVMRILDLRSGTTTALGGAAEGAVPLAFSADGRFLAGADASSVQLWEVGSGEAPRRFAGQGGLVNSAAFSHDGTSVVTGSDDGTLVVWDLSDRRRVGAVLTRALPDQPTTVWPVTDQVVIGQSSGEVLFVDRRDGTIRRTEGANPHLGSHGIGTARTGVDGTRLVVHDDTGLTTVWDTQSRTRLATLDVPQQSDGFAPDTWVSADGRFAATIRDQNGPLVIDLETFAVRQVPAQVTTGSRTVGVAGWTADGTGLILTGNNGAPGDVQIVDVQSGDVRWKVTFDDTYAAEAVADPLGRFVAVALDDGTLRILDMHDGHALAPPLSAIAGETINVSVSRDGRYVSTSGVPAYVTVWDTRTFRQVGTALPVDVEAPSARARFAPDGRLVVGSGAELRVFDVDPATWLARACREAGRTLTRDEWEEILPGRPYDPACT
jgi:DNA-binding SARP family transcriptional activator/WD40 repeat protein